MAPIAAKHGAQSRLKIMKLYAVRREKSAAMLPQISWPSSETFAKPYSTPKVPTTFSFAIRPVKVATAGFQVPKPRGAKIGATTWPMEASRLVLLSSTIPKRRP